MARAVSGRGLAALLVAVTAVRLVVAAWTPMTPDEAYYWVWSRALAPGYLDHPPMVALWIRAGTWLVGETALGVRLLGPVSALAGSWLLYRAGRDLGLDRAAARWAVVLLNATLLFGAGSVTMTPDTPLLFFWTLTLWGMGRVKEGQGSALDPLGAAPPDPHSLESRPLAVAETPRNAGLGALPPAGPGQSPGLPSPAWWLIAGAGSGLAMCSKYTGLLLPVGIGLWLLLAGRQWLLRPWPWAGAVVTAAVFAPTLVWNARHGWASFAKQGGRGGVFRWEGLAAHLGELVAGQVGLATPVIFVLCVAGLLVSVRRWRDPAAALLACLTVPAAAIFVEHALGDRVQANWPAIIYPAAVIAAARLGARWRRWFGWGAALGAGLTALVYVQGVAAPLPLSRRLDPSLRLAGGYAALAARVDDLAGRTGAGFVAADEYGAAALLAFLSPSCIPVVAIGPRWALFRLPSGDGAMEGRVGLLLRSARRRDAVSGDGWQGLAEVATLDRGRGGRWAERYVLYRGTGRGGATASAVLPVPAGRGCGADEGRELGKN